MFIMCIRKPAVADKLLNVIRFQNLRCWSALSDFFTVLQMLSCAKPLLLGILCTMFIMKGSKVPGFSFQGVIEKAAAIVCVAQFCRTFPIFCKVEKKQKSILSPNHAFDFPPATDKETQERADSFSG